MAKIIIFGIQDFAELAQYYLETDSDHSVVAFCVNEEYMPPKPFFKGLPIIAFEKINDLYPPADYKFFAPLSASKMNLLRESIYNQIKSKGYELISYVSSKATIFNTIVGDNCFIFENNTIQPFTNIGNNVILWSGNHIGHHSTIDSHVMFTSHVVLSGHCRVESYSFFGVNSTIRDGLVISEGSLIAMGACVFKNTESWGVYKGNPAVKSAISSKEIKF
jgi:sugar O-acyltransferase (sialic acid O-acetyltransferase NeuD family)